jgi:hypothetical protein
VGADHRRLLDYFTTYHIKAAEAAPQGDTSPTRNKFFSIFIEIEKEKKHQFFSFILYQTNIEKQ